MPLLDYLSETLIYGIAPTGNAAQAGLQLATSGAFIKPCISTDRTWLFAGCRGKERPRYDVVVDLAIPGHPLTRCNCLSYQSPCKHALGLLLLAVRAPEQFQVAAPPKALQEERRKNPATDAAEEVAEPEAPPDPASIEEAFFQAIMADPHDETARLIYADWLQEQDDPGKVARGQFIRIQCQLHHLPADDPQAEALRAQEAKLWKKYRSAWLKDVPTILRSRGLVFHRGFLEEMALPVRAFRRHGAQLLKHHPIHRFRLTGGADRQSLSKLAVWPLLARMTALDLTNTGVGTPQLVKAALTTPYLSQLTSLNLSLNQMTHAGARALVEIDALANLQALNLDHNAIGDSGAEALAGASHFATLRSLHLAGTNIGPRGATALAASPHLRNLTLLDLRQLRGKLTPSAVGALRGRFGDRALL
jgi:uncharacterized protein (TIGR02996 family)